MKREETPVAQIQQAPADIRLLERPTSSVYDQHTVHGPLFDPVHLAIEVLYLAIQKAESPKLSRYRR